MISMIAAIGEGNRVLGKNNKLVWNIPEDTKFFRDTTRGHVVIMGRKTYESMGRPLSQRTNIVITRDVNWQAEGVVVVHTIEEAIEKAKTFILNEVKDLDPLAIPQNDNKEIFIIGGGQIYKEALPFADRLYLTIVHGHFKGDAFFPEYSEFTKVISERKSEGNDYSYTFLTLEKAK